MSIFFLNHADDYKIIGVHGKSSFSQQTEFVLNTDLQIPFPKLSIQEPSSLFGNSENKYVINLYS